MAKKATKKTTRTVEELMTALWNLVLANHGDVANVFQYETKAQKIFKEMETYAKGTRVEIPGFSATILDTAKIRNEVTDSCLTKETKKSLLAALDKAEAK